MDRVWAPWRAQFVREMASNREGEAACFFCKGLGEDRDRENLLVWRKETSVVFLNRYPYNNGHLLVAPVVHEGSLTRLPAREHSAVLETVQGCVQILDTLLSPHGYNIGLNLGRAAGAGVPGHLHWHIVPRWDGDTNFMPVLADTKVIVQCLEDFYERFSAERSKST